MILIRLSQHFSEKKIRNGFVQDIALCDLNYESSDPTKSFINEGYFYIEAYKSTIDHYLKELERCYEGDELNILIKQLDQFKIFLEETQNLLEKLVSDEHGKQKLEQLVSSNPLNSIDKPLAVENLKELLRNIYDPIIYETGNRIFDEIVYLPLTKSWFEQNEELYEIFSNFDIPSDWTGGSGQVYKKDDEKFIGLIHDLNNLKNKINDFSEDVISSIEGSVYEWLMEIEIDELSNANYIILFSDIAWDGTNEYWYDFIAVDQTGPLSSLPLLSVMIHETNMTYKRAYLLNDTHTVTDFRKNPLTAEYINDLLETNFCIGIIYLRYYLNLLSN